MRLVTKTRLQLRSLFHRSAMEEELEEEFRYHIERQLEADIARGMDPAEARAAAQRALMGVEARKEECRDMRGVQIIDNTVRDFRFAVHQLRKTPAFTSVAVLVLTLGLSAAIAIFAYVDAALIKPLPYPDPHKLVGVTESAPMMPRANLSWLDYLDWKRMNTTLESLDVYSGSGFLLQTPAGVQPVPAVRVSNGFFRTLGVRPTLGRDFHPGEDEPQAPKTVMLTWPAWQTRFGGRQDLIGDTILLSGVRFTVIGVLPKDFQFAPVGRAELWVTVDSARSCEKRRSCHNLYGVGRLKDGVSVEAALANLTSIAKQLEQQYPDSNRGQGASVLPFTEYVAGPIRPILLVLLGGAGLLLLIACVNVASLLLVRAEHRRREFAIRGALGASTGRLISQFVTEGLVLVGAGGAMGLAFAGWSMQFLLALIPPDMLAEMPFLAGLGLNGRVLACAAVVLLLAAALFAITPAVHLFLSKMKDGLAEGSRGTAGAGWRRLGSRLVIVEFAMAMVLLTGAGLLGQSLYRLLRVETGFQPRGLATLTVAAPDSVHGTDEQSVQLGRSIANQITSLPGVQSVGLVSTMPISFNGNTRWVRFVGKPYNGEHNEVNARGVSSAYFSTIGATLRAGRYFSEGDDLQSRPVAIINRTLRERYFPGEDPIGKQFGDVSLSPQSIRVIVGVVDDIREGALNSEIWPAVYIPFNQDPDTYFAVVIRTANDPAAILPSAAAAVRKRHPEVGIMDEITMEQRMAMSMTACLHRAAAWLVSGFAALALLLGVVGLYGVVAYAVTQRTREIGVRMALGAAPGSVYGLILKEAARLVVAAAVLGLAASAAAATLMTGVFYGVRSWDAPVLCAVTVLLITAAILASYVPARRAAMVNPVEALRAE